MKVLKSPIATRVLRCKVILIALISVSIACSTSKSAPQTKPPENLVANQSSTPVITPSVQGSGPCTLKVSEIPVLNGLKLGMTPEQVLALFPGSKDDAELREALAKPPARFGNSTFMITPSKYRSGANYSDIGRVTFSLLDGRVSNFTISYKGPAWPHVDKFIEKFGEGKNLPPSDQWEPYEGMDTQMKTLTCDGFSVRIFIGGEDGNLNYVLVQDLEADNKLKDRRKKAREQASPEAASQRPPQ